MRPAARRTRLFGTLDAHVAKRVDLGLTFGRSFSTGPRLSTAMVHASTSLWSRGPPRRSRSRSPSGSDGGALSPNVMRAAAVTTMVPRHRPQPPGRHPPCSALVTGATGYIGGRLVPRLLEAGHEVRCMARDPGKLRNDPWHDQVEVVRGDVLDPASLDARARRVRCRLLPRPLDGRGARFADRDRTGRPTSERPPTEPAEADRLPGRYGLRRRPVRTPVEPSRGGPAPGRWGDTGHRAASRGHHRLGIGVVRDAPLPDRGPPRR